MRIKIVVTILALVLASSLAFSQDYYAKESFDYPIGASLDSLMGAASNGWEGGWYKIVAAAPNAAVVSDAGLPYDDLNYTVPHVGNHLESVPMATATEQRWGRRLDKTWPNEAGRTYWISFIMDTKNATDNATWLGVKLYWGDGGELGMWGKGHGMDKYTCGGGWHGGAGVEVSTTDWTTGPVWLVGKVVMQGAESTVNDSLYMWISPDPAGGQPAVAAAAALSGTASIKNGFNTVRIEFGGTVGDGLQVSFDELRLGTSWEAVSAEMYLATESFDYPVGTSIDADMGATGYGWEGSWYTIVAAAPGAAVVSDAGLPYDDLSYTIPNVGNHLESVPMATATEQRWGRHLDKTWPNVEGEDYWLSFIMDTKNATDNATWLGIKLYSGDGGELGMWGKGHGMDKYTCGGGWHGGTGVEVSTTDWTTGPVWIVGKVAMLGASSSNDSLYMWLSPDPAGGEPSTAAAAAFSPTAAIKNGFNTVRIEFGGTVGDGLQVSFDEFRMGTTWGDVSTPLLSTTGVANPGSELPAEFALSQNYPNPFNPTTSINYTLKGTTKVRLAVYNVTGREVAVLVDQVQNAGMQTAKFSGAGLPSGIYFYKLEADGQVFSNKMLLVK